MTVFNDRTRLTGVRNDSAANTRRCSPLIREVTEGHFFLEGLPFFTGAALTGAAFFATGAGAATFTGATFLAGAVLTGATFFAGAGAAFLTATFFTGLGCLMGPSVLYLALLAVTG